MRAHDPHATELQAFGEIENGATIHQRREGCLRRKGRGPGHGRFRGPGGRDPAADDALAGVGLKAVDPARLVRQPLPDRQQQASDDVERAVGELRHVRHFASPGGGERLALGRLPVALVHHLQRRVMIFHRPDQPHAAFDFAIVQHQARGWDLHGGAARALVHQQQGAGIAEMGQRLIERHRAIAAPFGDRQQPRLCARCRMGVDGSPIGDDEAFGLQRLQTNVIDAAGDGALHLGVQQLLERREEHALQRDGQRQQAVEEGRDRRQLVLDAVGIHQLEACGVLEHLQRAALDLAANQKQVELAQRVAGVVGFEIVLRPEQTLAAGLALAARNRAQRVEPAGDGREEALLGLHIRRDRSEERRLGLVGAVGPPEALDRGVGFPAGFEEVVDA